MVEAIILSLIYIVLLAVAVYLVFWVVETIGLAIPAKIQQLIWIVFVLIAILILVRLLLPRIALIAGPVFA